MELLLLVLVIPLIPFYIISTFISFWILLLGIPLVILYAVFAFIYGLIQAIMTRKVIPSIQSMKNKLRQVQVDGRWTRGSFNRSPPPNQRTSSISRGLDRNSNVNNQNSARNLGSSSPVLSTDTAINNRYHASHAYGMAAIAVFLVQLLERILNLGNDGHYNMSDGNDGQNDIDDGNDQRNLDFLQELADEADIIESPANILLEELAFAVDEQIGNSQQVFEQLAENRSFPYPPTNEVFETSEGLDNFSHDNQSILSDMILEDLVSALSFDQSVKSRAQSRYSVPSVYRSTLDDLADASEIELETSGNTHSTQKLSFFEKIARSIPRDHGKTESNFSKSLDKGLKSRIISTKPPLRTLITTDQQRNINGEPFLIGPGDSASQYGNSETGKKSIIFSASEDEMDDIHRPTDNGETTDAAKMLFMFGAVRNTTNHSPERSATNLNVRNSLSPLKKYFLPGL